MYKRVKQELKFGDGVLMVLVIVGVYGALRSGEFVDKLHFNKEGLVHFT